MASEYTSLVKPTVSSPRESHAKRNRIIKAVIAATVAFGLIAVLVAPWKLSSGSFTKVAASADSSNPYVCGDTTNEAGYIKLANKKDGHYFYWFFQSKSEDPAKDPLVIWLTGGGGSSMIALMNENGPCTVQSDLSTKNNPYSWNQQANMIWLDQPIGVGFSYGAEPEDKDFNGTNVGENLYWFLQGFIEKHPEFDNREFFLTGESYAGHYIPAGAHYIWEQNKLGSAQPGSKHINLQGIAIGNGLVNPIVQYNHTIDIIDNAYNITLLTDAQREQLSKDTEVCIQVTRACQQTPTHGPVCLNATDVCGEKFAGAFAQSKRNPYDIREVCESPTFGICDGMDRVQAFFNLDTVRRYLNVAGGPLSSWAMVGDHVGLDFAFSGDEAKSYDQYIADLLDGGVRVLIYAGDADAICNWQGTKAWTSALQWSGKASFRSAAQRSFIAHDPINSSVSPVDAGLLRSFGNFTVLRVFNAGHMVPAHQPTASLDMINKFFTNEGL